VNRLQQLVSSAEKLADEMSPRSPESRKRPTAKGTATTAANRTIDYRVRFLKGHAYLYERTYVGSAGDGKPVRMERYLGRVNDARAKAARQLELKFMAVALEREQEAHQAAITHRSQTEKDLAWRPKAVTQRGDRSQDEVSRRRRSRLKA
jgi:hypothetical protein